MKKVKQSIQILICTLSLTCGVQAQEKLYPNTFPVQDVTLLDGIFKHARDLNIQTLLQYNVDRLMAPYRKEAGLTPKAAAYPNWDGLDGHVGGHYLSAMAMNYAATGNPECKKRMEYMIAELQTCMKAHQTAHPEWGKGYMGGMPNSTAIWSKFKKGDFSVYNGSWVPFYNIHKMYAGLRDAWLYAGNKEARTLFLTFCDWSADITSALSDAQMQSVLDMEHGGMNEVFADAYQMTGKAQYLTLAKRFSHLMLLNPLSEDKDNLDNKHANTQVPKAVGFERIAEVSHDAKFGRAGLFFWETVTQHRSLAFGGNSRREFFPSVSACGDFVNDVEGPETCNSFNMLKLTEDLFRVQPSARYADYYERTLYNHILSTQHPEHGGYVYFTPVRPRHYRVYSAPNEAMWCCVGSGMENHSKYNQFIYTHAGDSLFVNLFIASELQWKKRGITLRQETKFPDAEQTKLVVTKGSSRFKLMIRYPYWVNEGALQIQVNGQPVAYNAQPSSYIAIDRKWKKGDVIEVTLPMHNRIEQLPNVPDYIALLHGPILLGAKTGTEDLRGIIANDSRFGHIASGTKLPIDKAPVMVADDRSTIAKMLVPVSGRPLTFTAPNLKWANPQPIEFEPFFRIHDARYMVYWMQLSTARYQSYADSLAQIEKAKLALQNRTVDFVAPGEQQPEADHAIQSENSRTGNNQDAFFREAREGGYFSYLLATQSETELALYVRYWGAERGNRKFDIYIDDEKLITEENTRRWNQPLFQAVEYPIPAAMLQGKQQIRVKFQAPTGNTAGAVYYLRLVRKQ